MTVVLNLGIYLTFF